MTNIGNITTDVNKFRENLNRINQLINADNLSEDDFSEINMCLHKMIEVSEYYDFKKNKARSAHRASI